MWEKGMRWVILGMLMSYRKRDCLLWTKLWSAQKHCFCAWMDTGNWTREGLLGIRSSCKCKSGSFQRTKLARGERRHREGGRREQRKIKAACWSGVPWHMLVISKRERFGIRKKSWIGKKSHLSYFFLERSSLIVSFPQGLIPIVHFRTRSGGGKYC